MPVLRTGVVFFCAGDGGELNSGSSPAFDPAIIGVATGLGAQQGEFGS